MHAYTRTEKEKNYDIHPHWDRERKELRHTPTLEQRKTGTTTYTTLQQRKKGTTTHYTGTEKKRKTHSFWNERRNKYTKPQWNSGGTVHTHIHSETDEEKDAFLQRQKSTHKHTYTGEISRKEDVSTLERRTKVSTVFLRMREVPRR